MARRRPIREHAPELEAIYSDRNSVRFEYADLVNPAEPWWRCPEGHEWQERTQTRRNTTVAWKNGDVLACPHCAGILLTRACGHVTRHQPGQPGDPSTICWDCESAPQRVRWSKVQDQRGEIDAHARSLLADLDEPDGPETLKMLLRQARLTHLRRAASHTLIDGHDKAARRQIAKAEAIGIRDSLPGLSLCLACFSVPLGKKQAWGPGMAHFLGHPAAAGPDISEHVASLAKFLEHDLDESITTKELTDAIRAWAYDRGDLQRRSTSWQVARELTVPVAPGGTRLWGRVDLTIRTPEGADLVIEIDQTNKQESLEKLRFARDAGGEPIWIRWGSQPIEAPAWLPVIDLRPPDLAARERDRRDSTERRSERWPEGWRTPDTGA